MKHLLVELYDTGTFCIENMGKKYTTALDQFVSQIQGAVCFP